MAYAHKRTRLDAKGWHETTSVRSKHDDCWPEMDANLHETHLTRHELRPGVGTVSGDILHGICKLGRLKVELRCAVQDSTRAEHSDNCRKLSMQARDVRLSSRQASDMATTAQTRSGHRVSRMDADARCSRVRASLRQASVRCSALCTQPCSYRVMTPLPQPASRICDRQPFKRQLMCAL